MNEYDDILNRIVEEFYDTGRLVLNEVGGFQLRTVREIGGLSWEIFNTNQKVSGSQKEVNNYISMIEKFLTLNDHHKRIITEKNWWKPNDYVNIIDRYLNDTNRPIKDKLDFHNRIKEISDKLDNTPFSELKDIIKPFETFLRSKDELEKKQEDETPEVEKDLYVPDNTEETGDTEQTPEGETEVEEKRDITSIAKEVVNFGRKETELSIESNKILNTLIGDPKDKEDTIKNIGTLKKEIEYLNTRIREFNNLKGTDFDDSRKEVEEKIKERNDKQEELKEYVQELKDLDTNPIIYQLLNKKCLINTLLYGDNNSLERTELVDFLKEKFVKPLSQYGDVSTYSLHSTHLDKFKNKYGEERANKIKRYIQNPGMKPSETDKELEFCGVEEFDNTKIISRKKEEIEKEYVTTNTKIPILLNQAFNLVNEIFNEFMRNTQLQQKYAKTERYNKLIDIIKNYWSGDNDDERLYSLYNIIFDLNELLKLIKGLDIQRNIPKDIEDLINNIYKNVNDSDVIVDNFKEIREHNNVKYEKSFAKQCNNQQYFKKVDGGNNPAIVSGNNNIMLVNELLKKDDNGNLLPVSGVTETIFEKVRDLLNDEGLVEKKLRKYDIQTTQNVTLTPYNREGENIAIEKNKFIEVKFTKPGDYQFSEFFGVYKNKKETNTAYNTITTIGDPEENKVRYEQFVKELVYRLNGNEGKTIINTIKSRIDGIFFENYLFSLIDDITFSWSTKGQGSQGSSREDRVSIRVIPDMDRLYYWKEGNSNCDKFNKYPDCETDSGCPQNESTDRIDNIIENFFDTGNFVI